ncbi:hypothetical protein K438DRAFT_1761167 [Mycena galopus ATCC 62051]|nr:hypothetical protein K438DRAFT_1761167 [Mycena galopus ATCC 62051]
MHFLIWDPSAKGRTKKLDGMSHGPIVKAGPLALAVTALKGPLELALSSRQAKHHHRVLIGQFDLDSEQAHNAAIRKLNPARMVVREIKRQRTAGTGRMHYVKLSAGGSRMASENTTAVSRVRKTAA